MLSKIRNLSTKNKKPLVTYMNPNSIISEQFRTIRTNIHFLTDQNKRKVFLITSPNKQEGTSTAIANLAVSMAQNREKVLLIDANLRSPTLHQIFKSSNNIGLTNVINGSSELNEAIDQTGIAQLHLLTSGTISPNPSDVLGDYRMEELLEKVGGIYDLVLIDTPSVLKSTETRILASLCDGVFILLNRGKTKIEEAEESKKIMNLAHANVLGLLLNDNK
ncbi:polysaccharide biosynthesis tyrosine autokinase [Halobacillus litoralis]|uniref:non-specific protein-tyrosine kinase n=1 Tax=Halobacillus litoralis TaxID=45668 RepID=A0A845F890_9BACI|nr:CpsD/CapB family tyrosine-protein kinase [Halobacillus litoralis]MYL69895.1 polysaccharide biosynthesis tyrosine autokinase [Halobacillus litoralis]